VVDGGLALGVCVGVELLLIGFVLGVLVASVVMLRRRPSSSAPPAAADGERGAAPTGSWTAGAVGAAFPLERTPHERDIGDAAFVDGLVVGRYVFPDERALEQRQEVPPPDAGGDADDDTEFGAVDPVRSGVDEDAEEDLFEDPFAPVLHDGSHDDLDDDLDDHLDEGFGDGFDGFDDGFDDEW
jgi:hypothetical protein